MQQINYILRDEAGGMREGQIDADPGAYVLPARPAQRLSLNLRQSDIGGYVRQGNDLVLTLIDARVLRLESFFDAGDAPVRLYVSTAGFLNEIRFADAQEGALVAHFGPTAQAGRSSLSDMLMHDGPGGLTADAGTPAAEQPAALDEPAIEAPKAQPQADIKVVTYSSGADLSGRARPGSIVDVSFAGVTHTLRVSARGTWIADFTRAQLPSGQFTGTATVTETEIGGAQSTYSCELTIDMPVPLAETPDPEGEPFAVSEDGLLTIAGQADAGHSVDVLLGDVAANLSLAPDGNWNASFAAADFAEGPSDLMMMATATNEAGLSETARQPVTLMRRRDRLSLFLREAGEAGAAADAEDVAEVAEIEEAASDPAPALEIAPEPAAELPPIAPEDGVALTGSTEAFADVSVTANGTTRTGRADGAGDWQIVFSHHELPPAEYSAVITARVSEPDGMPSEASETVALDLREAAPAPVQAPEAEEASGIELAGQVEPGSTVEVLFGGKSFAATIDSAGNWIAAIPADAITPGSYRADVTVSATDPRGLMARITETLEIDTDAPDGPVVSARDAA